MFALRWRGGAGWGEVHVGFAVLRLEHRTFLYCGGEGKSLGTDLGHDASVGRAQVEVADAVGVLGDDGVVVPGDLEGRYIYATDHTEIRTILHILFSDQSHLTYINENLRGDNAVDLLRRNTVSYESLHEHQEPMVEKLIELGIVENTGDRIALKDPDLFRVLKSQEPARHPAQGRW